MHENERNFFLQDNISTVYSIFAARKISAFWEEKKYNFTMLTIWLTPPKGINSVIKLGKFATNS